MRFIFLTAFAALSLSTPAFAADATTNGSAVIVTVEVRASDRKEDEAAPPLEMVLALVEGCGELSEQRSDANYKLKVCHEPDDVLAFDLERIKTGPTGHESRQFRVKAELVPGKPAVIARFVEGQRKMEVRAGVKKPDR